jgi:hypothetical protein
MQLLIKHIPLNTYLNRFKLVDSTRCPASGAGPETVKHFLLHCPSYTHERWILEKRLRKRNKALTLENLLGDAEASVVMNYVVTKQDQIQKPRKSLTCT